METMDNSDIRIAAEQGLQKLIAGNHRFMQGQANFPTVCKEALAELAREQKPFATILGCSDSRVPPELIFDANFGELFIVRVGGNVVSPEVMGSLQYAGAHLRTPLFVVLGHAGCGAVKAALEYKLTGVEHRSRIQILVNNILPGLVGSPCEFLEGRNVAWRDRSECPLVDEAAPGDSGRSGGRQEWLQVGGSGLRYCYRRGAIPSLGSGFWPAPRIDTGPALPGGVCQKPSEPSPPH